jgi:hypothetical protein
VTQLIASLLKQPTLPVREASRLYRTCVSAGICTRLSDGRDCHRIVKTYLSSWKVADFDRKKAEKGEAMKLRGQVRSQV